MKKSIVLLITLMFIGAISLLILQNLKDSEKFFSLVKTNTNLTQTKVTIDNVNSEIIKFFNKYKDENLDDIFQRVPEILPLNYANINLSIKLTQLNLENKIYLNDKNISKKIDYHSIDNSYYFTSLLKDINVTNDKQVHKLVDDYYHYTKDKRIFELQDQLTFLQPAQDYIKCEYTIDINGLKSYVIMIFRFKSTKITYLDFYFLM